MPASKPHPRAVARALAITACLLMAAAPATAQEPQMETTLRVCADPNNMPFSNRRQEGFENKIAQLIASDLHRPLAYTWWAQRRGFIRKTLNNGTCDVIIGTPALDMISTTRPYYRSGYVFVTRRADNLTFSSMQAPELKHLTIGVALVGDDGANTPPGEALGQQGIIDNVRGYPVFGDYRKDTPPKRIIEAVENGKIDVAAVWGPLAGYYALKSKTPLRVTPITDTMSYLPMVFQFPIRMGVRRGADNLREDLDEAMIRQREPIHAILLRYGVPLM